MSEKQIDPQLVINDLLEQIKKLTLENSMLRIYINEQSNSSKVDESAEFLSEDAAALI